MGMPQVSKRIELTQTPIIGLTQKWMAMRPDVISLAQGVTYWPPPPEALDAAEAAVRLPTVHVYGPVEGMPDLRAALRDKVAKQNGLHEHEICVTHGANQAFVNLVLSLVDEGDRVVLFTPAYFDHVMTVTQTGGASNILWGPCDPVSLHPDIDWLRHTLTGDRPPKLVVICNPCNPTGVLLSRGELETISDMCAAAGSWLVVDETYEDFTYEGRTHHCVSGPHIVHVFSFSKAYGMMGWRVGYIAYMKDSDTGQDPIGDALRKCQDTICICAAQASQHAALAALRHGAAYKQSKLDTLPGTLGDGIAGGEGGIYFWARLPPCGADDLRACEWLVRHAGVCLVPGSAFNAPGWVRCSFGNLPPQRMQEACRRLKAGLTLMKTQGNLNEPTQQDLHTNGTAA